MCTKRWFVSVVCLMVVLVGSGGATGLAASEAQTDPVAYEVISLRGVIEAFLAEAENASVLDQGFIFAQMMQEQGAGCFESGVQLGDPLSDLYALTPARWPQADLGPWYVALESFPEDELIALAEEALAEAVAALPPQEPLRVCVMPVPYIEPPEVYDESTPNVAHLRSLLPLNAFAPNAQTVIVACSQGEACVDDVQLEVTRAYAFTQQHWYALTTWDELELPQLVVYEGRADAFALELYPDAVFPWTDAFSMEDHQRIWNHLTMDLPHIYAETRVYGTWLGTSMQWAGVYLGGRLVEFYRAEHPDMEFGALFAEPIDSFWAMGGQFAEE